MRKVVVSAKARADIEAIADLISHDAARNDPAQASRCVEALGVGCASPPVHPFQGRPAPAIVDDLRLLVLRSCVSPHRVLDGRRAVDRVMHGARDRPTVSFDE